MKVGTEVKIGALVAFGLITLNSSFYQITEQQQGVVTRFGKVQEVTTAGLHTKIPYIDRVTKVPTITMGMPIGYTTGENGEDGEAYTVNSDSNMITSDFNFINTDFYIEYRISDPVKALYSSDDPEGIIANTARACIRTAVSKYKVDEVMTTGKGAVQADVKDMMIKELADSDIGITVVNVSIQDVEPPTDQVAEAFKEVENAKQGADTAINNANKYKSEKIPEAEAAADNIVKSAEAQKSSRIAEAEGQTSRFKALYDQYKNNPTITKQRLFYETMESVLPNLKLIIDDGGTQKIYPISQFSTTAVNAETK